MATKKAAKKSAKKTATKSTKKPAKKAKKPRQRSLVGMEDRAITELDDAAEELKDIQEDKAGLVKKEKDQKEILIALMKKWGKTTYSYGKITILVSTKDDVKATVKRDDDEPEEEEPAEEVGTAAGAE